jgi:hypothetical protein
MFQPFWYVRLLSLLLKIIKRRKNLVLHFHPLTWVCRPPARLPSTRAARTHPRDSHISTQGGICEYIPGRGRRWRWGRAAPATSADPPPGNRRTRLESHHRRWCSSGPPLFHLKPWRGRPGTTTPRPLSRKNFGISNRELAIAGHAVPWSLMMASLASRTVSKVFAEMLLKLGLSRQGVRSSQISSSWTGTSGRRTLPLLHSW